MTEEVGGKREQTMGDCDSRDDPTLETYDIGVWWKGWSVCHTGRCGRVMEGDGSKVDYEATCRGMINADVIKNLHVRNSKGFGIYM